MSISLVASVTQIRGSASAAIDTTGATLLVASTANAFSDATISDSKGNTWRPLTSHIGGSSGYHKFYYCLTPIVGTGHTFTPAGTYASCVVYAFAGVGSYQTESGAGIGSSATGPVACGSVTPLQAGALIVSGLAANTFAVDAIAPAGFTQTTISNGAGVNLQNSTAYYVQPTAATINPTWTWSSGSHDYTGASAAVFLAKPPDVVLLVGAEIGILDESPYARTLTAVGNAARTTTQAKHGTASLTFDGTGDWIQTPVTSELSLAVGDFTVEGWFRFVTKTTDQALFGHWNSSGFVASSSWFLYVIGGVLKFRGVVSSATVDLDYTWTPTLGQWYHIAVDRVGTTVRMYVGGAVVGTGSYAALNTCTDLLTIGAIGTTSNFSSVDFNGQMDEIRITKGFAQYAGAFTPPTAPFTRGITLITSVTASPGINGGTTAAVDTTGANLLVWSIGWYAAGGALTAPTDSKGNTWIPLTQRGPSQYATHRFFYAKNAIVGPGHTFTAAGAGSYATQLVHAFAGASSNPFLSESGAMAQVAPLAAGSVTPSVDGAVIVASYACETNPSNTGESVSPTMLTTVVGSGPTGRGLTGIVIQTAAAPINPTWTWSGSAGVVAATAVFAPASAPVKVQSTPRVRSTVSTTVAIPFSTPPLVGNALVVSTIIYRSGGVALGSLSCADNFGNTYILAKGEQTGNIGTAIFLCSKVVTTGALTVTITLSSGLSYFEANAIEVGNVGSGLVVDQAASGFGSGATGNTGTTPALTKTDVFVTAVLAIAANITSITVQSVTPSWNEEFENLDYTTTVAGEVDSRSLMAVGGSGQTCSWTWTTSTGFAGVIAVFAPTTGLTVGVAFLAPSLTMTAPNVTPSIVGTAAQVSQLAVEVLKSPSVVSATVSQVSVEVLIESSLAAASVSQVSVEIAKTPPIVLVSVSQVAVEVLTLSSSSLPARIAQMAVEVMISPASVSTTTGVGTWTGGVGGMTWVE